MATVSKATVSVPISGPYRKSAAKLKASPTEKLAATSRMRGTVTPLMMARTAGISQAGSNGAAAACARHSKIATMPAGLTDTGRASPWAFLRLIGPIGGLVINE
jgi:hypothetical protein